MPSFNHSGGSERHHDQHLIRGRKAIGLALALGALLLAARPASAQVTYVYAGMPFTLFSCGGNSDCPTPGPNANTSYTATDIVTATLSFTSALPANMGYGDVSTLPGFKLMLNDGHQTLTATAGYSGGFLANISTDASGNIAQWALVVNCCFYPNNGVATANDPGGNGVFDSGTLSAASPNNGYPNTPNNLALNTGTPGKWGPAVVPCGLNGTAARVIMTGSAYGMSIGTIDGIFGGDGKTSTMPWNFAIPSGWSYARGTITGGGPQAGAYSATSGPCGGSSGASCGVGAGRGVAYQTYCNISSQPLTFKVNAVLDGNLQYSGIESGGVATAGVFIVDAAVFANTISNSGLPTPQFLLNGSNITNLETNGANSLALLFPSGVLLDSFKTVTTPVGQFLTIPITSSTVTVQPNEPITLVFDVSAYALSNSSVNFASTLAPSTTLPLFADATTGAAVTQLVPMGPTAPVTAAPASLVLTPATASMQAGGTANVTATVTDSGGNPIPNAAVFIAFGSGPNAGVTGPISTDATGTAVFTYTDNGGAGTDVIQATLGSLTAVPATVAWTSPGPLDHITITPATATIAFGGSQTYTATAYDRFSTAIGNVTSQTVFNISPTGGTCSASSCTASVSGTYTVTGTYSGKTAQASLTVSPIVQVTPTVTWTTPAPIQYGTALSGTQLNATASVGGSFSYSPQAGQVLRAGIQTLSVTFMPGDTTHYTNATATVNLQVTQAQPVVSWATPAPITAGTALSATQLNATANIAGSFAYSPLAGTILGAGSQTLKVSFTPTDSVDYTGVSAQVTLVVNPAGKTTPTITWVTPAPIVYGTPLGLAQLNATTTVAGVFTYSQKAGTILTAGAQILTVTFVPTNTSLYSSATASVTIQVNKATPQVLWLPLPLIYGIPLGPLQLDAFTLVPGTFSYTPGVGTILPAGEQTLSAKFTPHDTSNYNSISVQATLLVLKACPVIKWPVPAAIVVGTPLSATQLNATANVPGTFVYSPAAGTKLAVGTTILNVNFTPTDSANYQKGALGVPITVKSH